MFLYDDYLDPNAPGYDPNAPGAYAPPGYAPPDTREPGWFGREFDGLPPTPYNSHVGEPGVFGDVPPPPPKPNTNTGGGMSEAEGRAYDAAHGLLGGYMGRNGWVSGEPRSGGGVSTGTGGTGGTGQFDYGRAPGMLPFSAYQSMAPFASAQGPLSFEPFSYESFTPSSREDAQAEPGFAASQERLSKMIQNSAAYKGVLRSGATIGDLGTYLGQNEGQNFQQFDARRFRNYSANRGNAADAWTLNTGAKADAWKSNLGAEQFTYGQRATENDRGNNFRFNTEKASFDDMLGRWQSLVNATTQLARPV